MKKMLQGTVNLPGSKSESNRALMISAYGGFPLEVDGLSDAHDTVLLKTLLGQIDASTSLRAERSNDVVVDCEDAGTVARFLLTYLAGKPGTWLLTGTQRLCERPMAPLIDALRQLGAEIEGEGLPLKTTGKSFTGGSVTLDASLSSQFASSLLMAAPTWEHGLQLSLTGNPVSMPYLEMTIKMMELFGVHVVRNGNVIRVDHQPYHSRHFTVSPDWSAASYWYEMAALSDDCDIVLKGLKQDSFQGDAAVAKMYEVFGVRTSFCQDGVTLSKSFEDQNVMDNPATFDFSKTPDLFPAIFVTCIALHYPAVFQGILNLSIKESNRIESLIMELKKYYTFINILYSDSIVIDKSSLTDNYFNDKKVLFNTYQDHRVAMSLAPLRLKLGKVSFDHPEVVTKSYPMFWQEMQTLLRNNYY